MPARSAVLNFRAGAFILLAGAVLGLAYFNALTRLVTVDWSRADFDYCYLIPLVIAYLLWEDRKKFQSVPAQPSWVGLVPILFGVGFLFLGELGGEFLSLYLSLWFMILGLCWSLLGWRKLKVILFPIFFLLTAFPPPQFFYTKLTLGMQLISSSIGTQVLHLLGVSAYRTGNVIDLGFTQMQVVDACSGLRFLIPMLIMALLLVYLFKLRWWKRGLVLASAVPLAVVLNGVRIGILGYLAQQIDASIISGKVHDITGWIMFFAGTGIMFAMLHILGRLGEGPGGGAERQAQIQDDPVQDGARRSTPFPLPFVLALSVLLGSYGFLEYKTRLEPVLPQARELGEFPKEIGPWSGSFRSMSQQLIDSLDLSDYLQVSYAGPKGGGIDFYVAWYASQSKGESIHSPETCLRGGGWQFVSGGETEVDIPGYAGSPLRVNRSVLKQGDRRMLSYFWFPVRGRQLVNAYELKLFTLWGSLTRNRTDGALVRIMTTIGPDEGLDQAESRLQSFLARALPILDKYLPE